MCNLWIAASKNPYIGLQPASCVLMDQMDQKRVQREARMNDVIADRPSTE